MLDDERLDVYRCSLEHLARVLDWISRRKRGNAALADPWRRASMSIPLHIGEAAGKVSVAERRIARGEAMECGAILDVVQLLHEVPDAELADGKQLVVRIVGMLSKMCR